MFIERRVKNFMMKPLVNQYFYDRWSIWQAPIGPRAPLPEIRLYDRFKIKAFMARFVLWELGIGIYRYFGFVVSLGDAKMCVSDVDHRNTFRYQPSRKLKDSVDFNMTCVNIASGLKRRKEVRCHLILSKQARFRWKLNYRTGC